MSPRSSNWWKHAKVWVALTAVAVLLGVAVIGAWAAVNSVNIDSPTNASPAYVKPGQNFTVQYDADGDEVVTIQVLVGGSLQFSESKLLPVTNRTISVPAPASEGKKDLEVRAVGSTTKSKTETEAVWVDGTEPNVSIASIPACIQNPNIAGTASDTLSGVAKVQVKIKDTTANKWWDGSTWVSTDPGWLDASGTTTWSYSGVSWVDGHSFSVWAKATDKAGNETSTPPSVSFTVDQTPPTIAITNPPSGWVNSLPTLSGTASDTGGCGGLSAVKVQVYNVTGNRYWNGSAWVSSPVWNDATIGVSGWSYTMPALTSGRQYIVKAKAEDGAGNSSSEVSASFWYDDTPPTVSITVPEDGKYYRTMPGAFSGTASDAHSGMASVELTLTRSSDGKYWAPGTGWVITPTSFLADSTAWEWDARAVTWTDGETYTLSAKGNDNAGNDPSVSVTFGYDVTPPTVSIDAIDQACDITTVSGSASDTFAGVEKVYVRINGGAWKEAEYDAGEWTFEIDNASLTDHATIAVEAKAVDAAGNEATDSNSFVYDACPAVAITSPADGAFVGTSVTVEGTADDGAGAVVLVQVQLDNGAWVNATDTSIGGTWATWTHTFTGLSVGNHTIRAKAIDDANQETITEITVKVPSGLSVSVNPIANHTQPTGFSGTAGRDVAQVKITIQGPSGYWNGYAWQSSAEWLLAAGTTSWSYDASLVPFMGGETYTVTAKAFDALGTSSAPDSKAFVYGASWDIQLNAGWNLISLPLIPNDENIASVMAGLPVVRVSQWTPGVGEQRWEPDPSPIKQFTTMTTGRGYWVRMSSAATLTNKGLFQPRPPAAPKSYALSAGWNLIGYHVTQSDALDDPKTVEQYLGTLLPYVRAMYYFDEGMYKIPAATNAMKVGYGYWVALDQAGTLYP